MAQGSSLVHISSAGACIIIGHMNHQMAQVSSSNPSEVVFVCSYLRMYKAGPASLMRYQMVLNASADILRCSSNPCANKAKEWSYNPPDTKYYYQDWTESTFIHAVHNNCNTAQRVIMAKTMHVRQLMGWHAQQESQLERLKLNAPRNIKQVMEG
eukprot:1160905-Pelagomonas_calceolata.AAC.4